MQVGRANWRELCNRGVKARHRPNGPVNCVRPAWCRCQGGRGLLIYRLRLQRRQREIVSPRGACRVILGSVLPKKLKDARAIGIAIYSVAVSRLAHEVELQEQAVQLRPRMLDVLGKTRVHVERGLFHASQVFQFHTFVLGAQTLLRFLKDE